MENTLTQKFESYQTNFGMPSQSFLSERNKLRKKLQYILIDNKFEKMSQGLELLNDNELLIFLTTIEIANNGTKFLSSLKKSYNKIITNKQKAIKSYKSTNPDMKLSLTVQFL